MRYLLVVGLIFLALAAGWHSFTGLRRYEQVMVIVARFDLPEGVSLNAGLIDVAGIPRRNVKPGAFEVNVSTDLKAVYGLETAAKIPKGRQLTRGLLTAAVKKEAAAPPEDDRNLSEERYLEGVREYGRGEYQKARREFAEAVRLDPGNIEAAKELRHVEERLAGK